MGANAIVTGILDISMAARLRKAAFRGKGLLIFAGLVSLAFGILVFLFPGAGALALVWMISFYAVLSGILLLAAAWRARKAERAEYDHVQGGVPARYCGDVRGDVLQSAVRIACVAGASAVVNISCL